MINSMRRIFAVFAREFFSLLASASAWVFLVVFVLLSGFLTFMVSGILDQGQADLSIFFDWMPWLFLLAVPALAMPLWSEERRTGTLELTLSYPATLAELVAGKFFAGLAVLFCALVFTLGTPLTVAYLGKPDLNAVLCGYLGALMAGAVFLAVSCWCSALTRSQTASFLLSLCVCSALMFTGWDKVSGYLALHLPENLCRWISYFAIIPHYQAFQRGLIDTSELAYLILTTLLFLFLTGSSLAFSASGIGSLFRRGAMRDAYTWRRLGRLAFGVAVAFYCYFMFNYAAGVAPVRFDVTADKAYSLTAESRRIVSHLSRPVSVRLYLSPENSGIPRPLLRYGDRVRWLLRELERESGGKLELTVLRPEEDSREEEAAQMDGLTPIQTPTGDRYYLGISVASGKKISALPSLAPEQEARLEYEIVCAILNTAGEKKPVIGVMSAMPILGRAPDQMSGAYGDNSWDIISELRKEFTLVEIGMDAAAIPDGIDALFIFHPAGIDRRALFAVDQYLMRGGKIAAVLDPMTTMRMENSPRAVRSAQQVQSEIARRQSDLGPLTAAWGVAYDKDLTAADMNFKTSELGPGGVYTTNPSVMSVPAAGLDRTSAETSRLTGLYLRYPGFFLPADAKKGLTYRPLAATSKYAKAVSASDDPALVFAAFANDKNAQNGTPLPLVLKISGRFETAFPDGAPDAAALDGGEKPLAVSRGNPEVVLIGDADMFFRPAYHEKTVNAYGQTLDRYKNDNAPFIQNILETLAGAENLTALRSRLPMSRPLTRIRDSRREAEVEFSARIQKLSKNYLREKQAVEFIRWKLAAGGGGVRLNEQETELLKNFSLHESEFKRETRALRNQLKAGLDKINADARLVNLALVPGLLALLGMVWSILRRLPARRKRS